MPGRVIAGGVKPNEIILQLYIGGLTTGTFWLPAFYRGKRSGERHLAAR